MMARELKGLLRDGVPELAAEKTDAKRESHEETHMSRSLEKKMGKMERSALYRVRLIDDCGVPFFHQPTFGGLLMLRS